MTSDPPFWWRQLCSAIRLNATNEALRAIAHRAPSTAVAANVCADWLRQALPYHFDGATHRILSLREAQARGYGACGDATAAIAAMLFLRSVAVVAIAYETTAALDGYAHVRVALGRTFIDAYPEASVTAPAVLLPLTPTDVRWPASMLDVPHR